MKKNKDLNSDNMNNLSEMGLIHIKKFLPIKEYFFLREFQSLSNKQKQYVLATMKNLKKYHL